jgi:hypothetical protein
LEIENNIAPVQNIRHIKLIKFYSNTCFGEMSSKYTSIKTAFVISISVRSVFIFPKRVFISPYPSNYFYYLILQIKLNTFNTVIFNYVCVCVCKAQSAILKQRSVRLCTVLQCWKALKIRDHREGKTSSLSS